MGSGWKSREGEKREGDEENVRVADSDGHPINGSPADDVRRIGAKKSGRDEFERCESFVTILGLQLSCIIWTLVSFSLVEIAEIEL